MRFWRPAKLTLPNRRDERIVLAALLTTLLSGCAIAGVFWTRSTTPLFILAPLVTTICLETQLAIMVASSILVGIGCALLIGSTLAYWVAMLAAIPIAIVDLVLRVKQARAAGMDGNQPV